MDITPSITPTPIPYLLLGKVVDVTLPDGAPLQPGASETKTWRLTNKGSCTWDSSFSLAYKSGNLPVRNPYVALSRTVRPGETIDVSVPVMAPQSPGTYTSYFWLRDGSGNFFGSGIGADTTFWVKIVVPEVFKVTNFEYMYNETVIYTDSSGKCMLQIPFTITTNGPGTVDYYFDSYECDVNQKCNSVRYRSGHVTVDKAGPQQLNYSIWIFPNIKYIFYLRIDKPYFKKGVDIVFKPECKKSS